uniref:Phospholipid-transporting ATPase n=1 Tax=Trypanosoma congolense (strain IL3000) TaxID=1068625 RepID=G0UNV2_TRYCI|nr:putative phospholipid-translocating P-type ATPase (flippase) [Trypanosoma congolense IL3000]
MPKDSGMRLVAPLNGAVAEQFCDNRVTNSRYTVWNFLFLNFYEQFRHPINFYFLLVASLQFVSVVAPVNPFSVLLPLLFTFTVTALKAGYDDVKRHRQDKMYNDKERKVINRETREWEWRKNRNIRVGDVIYLTEDEDIPCDAVVLASSSPIVYIRTDNLDGELDLKPRDIVAPNPVGRGRGEETEDSSSSNITVRLDDGCCEIVEKVSRMRLKCSAPTSMINSFDGVAVFLSPSSLYRSIGLREDWVERDVSVSVSLSENHILPQSCVLKNTKAAICLAIYTGEETKCSLNKRCSKVKWAKIDREISRHAIFLFVFQLSCAFGFGFAGYFFNLSIDKKYWYLPVPESESGSAFAIYALRFFLLTTVFIPISFKFVTDMTKHYLKLVIEGDEAMVHDGEGCFVRNSSIVEDLGQVDYVLTDKTGTLTQNVMELLYVTVNGKRICLRDIDLSTKSGDICSEDVLRFARVLSLCNTVEVINGSEESSGDVERRKPVSGKITSVYQAASPDEVALCDGCRKLRVTLISRTADAAVLDVNGVRETWRIHHVFHFTSEFKTMGIIVEDEKDGTIYYLVKGADDRILEMSLEDSPFYATEDSENVGMISFVRCVNSEVEHYAMNGLRTLLVAQKKLTQEELQNFLRDAREAEFSMDDRKNKVKNVRLAMENSVHVLGVTAIEDKLQEYVPETVSNLMQAGIKVWMLTGDKVQTAEQIAVTCSLCSPRDRFLRLTAEELGANDMWEDRMTHLLDIASGEKDFVDPNLWRVVNSDVSCGDSNPSVARSGNMGGSSGDDTQIIVDSSLSNPLSTAFPYVLLVEGGLVLQRILDTPELLELLIKLSAKCSSVICARTTPRQKAAVARLVCSRGFLTLAVGDGGNDVAMIQEAHVGVGISGKEGRQAVRASDFSISRFSDLRSLLFVHGQLAYTRTAFVIKYSFYKSVLIGFVQLVHNICDGYVSGGSFWDSLGLTLWNGLYSLPQTLLYCLDRKVPRTVLEMNPRVYNFTRSGFDLSGQEFFFAFVFRGVVHAVLVYILVLNMLGSNFVHPGSGSEASRDVAFSVAYTVLIFLQVLIMILESHTITVLNAFFIFVMPVLYVGINYVFSSMERFAFYGVWSQVSTLVPILICVAVICALKVSTFGLLMLWRMYNPDPRDYLRARESSEIFARRSSWKSHGGLSRLMCCFTCVPEEESTFTAIVVEGERKAGFG